MTHEQRKLFAEKLLDLANIDAGALVFGQFISGTGVNIHIFIYGIIIASILYSCAFAFSRERG